MCNPLWTMRGLSQTLHLWRETQRTSGPPLSTYLTYVMLPWHTIITGRWRCFPIFCFLYPSVTPRPVMLLSWSSAVMLLFCECCRCQNGFYGCG